MNTTATLQRGSDDLEWLREIRRKITSDFGHDQKKIGDYQGGRLLHNFWRQMSAEKGGGAHGIREHLAEERIMRRR